MLLSCVVLVVKLQQSRQKDDDVAALQKRLNFIMKEKKVHFSSFALLLSPVFALHIFLLLRWSSFDRYTHELWRSQCSYKRYCCWRVDIICCERKTANTKKKKVWHGNCWVCTFHEEFFVIFSPHIFRLNCADFTWMCSNSLSSRFSPHRTILNLRAISIVIIVN